jgi:hypothetical protein
MTVGIRANMHPDVSNRDELTSPMITNTTTPRVLRWRGQKMDFSRASVVEHPALAYRLLRGYHLLNVAGNMQDLYLCSGNCHENVLYG